MKMLLKSLLFLLLVVFLTLDSFAEEYTFRKTTWGMSKSQVKSSEPLDVGHETEDALMYKTTVIDKDVIVGYIFVADQLVRAKYILSESHTNKNDFIIDYNDFKEILTRKYGAPEADDTIWKDDLYKNDRSNWGMAISLGDLVYLSRWQTQDTEIYCILRGENFEISCQVEYASKNLGEMEAKAKEKKALNDF